MVQAVWDEGVKVQDGKAKVKVGRVQGARVDSGRPAQVRTAISLRLALHVCRQR